MKVFLSDWNLKKKELQWFPIKINAMYMYSTCDKKGSTTSGHTLDGWNPAPPGMYKTSQKPENNRINMDKLQTSPEFFKKLFSNHQPWRDLLWCLGCFSMSRFITAMESTRSRNCGTKLVHSATACHVFFCERYPSATVENGLQKFGMQKKEFLWGLSVLYVKYQMKTYKKKVNFRT